MHQHDWSKRYQRVEMELPAASTAILNVHVTMNGKSIQKAKQEEEVGWH